MTKVQIVVSDADDVPTAVLVEYTTVYIDPRSTHVIACNPTLGQRAECLQQLTTESTFGTHSSLGQRTECLRTGTEGTRSSLGRFQYGSSMMNESNLHAMESHIITILQNMNEEEHIRNNIQKRICKRLVLSIFIIGVLFVGFYMVLHKEARSM
jgi:hypothetical protein